MLEEMTSRLGGLVNEVAKQYISFDNQLQDMNAAYALLKSRDLKPSKDFVAPATPGLESNYRKRPQLDRLRLYERNAWQLCTAFNELESLPIYDQLFTPREVFPQQFLTKVPSREIDRHFEEVSALAIHRGSPRGKTSRTNPPAPL